MNDFIILIPALNPPKDIFKTYLSRLRQAGFTRIVIVNDGSNPSYRDFFNNLYNNGYHIFTHYKNLGKGRSLKNAFNYIINTYTNFSYIITADSDGQHGVDDLINIVRKIKSENKAALYLGSRDFKKSDIPIRSSFGNRSTSLLYRLLFNDRITDTQTGLRAIPKSYLIDYLDLDGEGFDYEINMLINTSKSNKNIIEVPIETIYIDNNSESHFNPFTDSFKIYKVMFKTFMRFIISSLASFLLDLGLFTILIAIFKKYGLSKSKLIFISTAIARILSGIFNYRINKSLVFNDLSKKNKTFTKYAFLWLGQLLLSSYFVDFLTDRIDQNVSLVKIGVDMIIFILSFFIQQNLVFNGRRQ